MWIGESGRVTDRIEFLGTRDICLYLVKGRDAMIVGGGMSYIAPSLERQFAGMSLDMQDIKYVVIPHSHFDHCGAVPYLKRKFPHAEIVASAYAAQLFSKPKVMHTIARSNRAAIEAMGLDGEYERLNLEVDAIQVDRVATEGEAMDLGDGLEALFIETRGHTRCSLAVYCPQLRAMFPSDAAPCPLPDGRGLVMPSPQYDFPSYVESLEKLAGYDTDVCAFDHHGALLGEQARCVLPRGLKRTKRFKQYVDRRYRERGELEEVAEEIASEAARKNELPFLSRELQGEVAKTSVRRMLAV